MDRKKYSHSWIMINKNLTMDEFHKKEENELHEAGENGWELVQVIEYKKYFKYYLKRIKKF
jgi:hypothetical protein